MATSLRSDSSDDENENVVLIPPFEDSEEEEGIRRILGGHGIRARTTREGNDPDMRARLERRDETEMDPDGEDADMDACVSSREPSRAGSPVLTPPIHVPMPVQPSDTLRVRAARARPTRFRRPARQEAPVGEGDLDLAGVCFDPTGSWVYVASMTGVVEWSVRGAEKRWWYDSEWA